MGLHSRGISLPGCSPVHTVPSMKISSRRLRNEEVGNDIKRFGCELRWKAFGIFYNSRQLIVVISRHRKRFPSAPAKTNGLLCAVRRCLVRETCLAGIGIIYYWNLWSGSELLSVLSQLNWIAGAIVLVTSDSPRFEAANALTSPFLRRKSSSALSISNRSLKSITHRSHLNRDA